MRSRLINNITIVCEGLTETNYLCGLKKIAKSKLNIITHDAHGGGYTSVLKKLKQTSAFGCVARYVVVDFDRFIQIPGERAKFYDILDYCKSECKKGNPTFLIVSNPDFDHFVLSHDGRFSNQDKENFLKINYGYKTKEQFKSDSDIFYKFNNFIVLS